LSTPETLATLCQAPRGEDGPVFDAPWQARAFALTLALHDGGHLSWSDWTAALAVEIAAAPDRDYYDCWLTALEKLLPRIGI